jgi:hypothetical protein
MQSTIDGNHQVSGDVWAILCAPSCLGAHKMIKRFLFFFSPVRDADTLHVVGSYHDPTTCKVLSEQNILFWSSRAAPDAMVVLFVIHVIRLGFVRGMFFSNFLINKTTKIDRNLIFCLPFLVNLRRTD